MNKEAIEERKAALLKDKKHYESMCILLDGAMQDCDYWLEQIKKADTSESSESEDSSKNLD